MSSFTRKNCLSPCIIGLHSGQEIRISVQCMLRRVIMTRQSTMTVLRWVASSESVNYQPRSSVNVSFADRTVSVSAHIVGRLNIGWNLRWSTSLDRSMSWKRRCTLYGEKRWQRPFPMSRTVTNNDRSRLSCWMRLTPMTYVNNNRQTSKLFYIPP